MGKARSKYLPLKNTLAFENIGRVNSSGFFGQYPDPVVHGELLVECLLEQLTPH